MGCPRVRKTDLGSRGGLFFGLQFLFFKNLGLLDSWMRAEWGFNV